MVGFSRDPEKAVDANLKFDLISSEPDLKSHKEGLTVLYSCEYVNIDGYLQEHSFHNCSDQFSDFLYSLHYGYCYGYDLFSSDMRDAELATQHSDVHASIGPACDRAFPRDINWSDAGLLRPCIRAHTRGNKFVCCLGRCCALQTALTRGVTNWYDAFVFAASRSSPMIAVNEWLASLHFFV